MKKRTFSFFKKKYFTYTAEDLKIKSDVELSEEQIEKVDQIVQQEIRVYGFYNVGYVIARKIVYELNETVYSATVYPKKKRILIKLTKKDF